MITDAHLHTWDTAEVGIGWLAEAGLPGRAPLPEDPGPRRYVLVEADADERWQETAWLAGVARRDRRVHGVVAGAALEGSGFAAELDWLAELPEVVGVRRLLQDRGLFTNPGLLSGLRLLAERGLPFDACVRARELPELTGLLARVPELDVVLDHMGKPPVGDAAALRRWEADLARAAELPHVHCKLSGLPAECPDGLVPDSVVEDVVGHALRVFGTDRCMVGSDRPVSRDRAPGRGPDRDWCARVLDLVPGDQRERLAHLNATKVYRRTR